MGCARCEALENQVADLICRLKIDVHESLLLSVEWGLTPNEAWMVHQMYNADGKPVPVYHLYEERPIRYAKDRPDVDPELIRVMICKLRKKMGNDLVKTVPRSGYALTAQGMARVKQVFDQRVRA